MTVSNEIYRHDYAGNDSTVLFAIGFYFLVDAHIKAILYNSVTDVETVLTLTTHYTLTGAGNVDGGELTMIVAPTSDESLTILRNVDLKQETNYVEGASFPAEDHEEGLDKLTMQMQQIQEQLDRLVTQAESQPGNLTLPAPIEDYFLRWASNELVNFDITDLSLYTVSSFIETLLNDLNSAAARATLEALPGKQSYFIDATETDQGLTGNGKTIKAYVDVIGTSKKATLVLTHSSTENETTYTLTTSETIPDNITLEIENGAIIDGVGTLTIGKSFKAGLYQVFGSSITISNLKKVKPEWWGAIGDDSTICTTAIEAAIATGKNVFFDDGIYLTTGDHRIATERQHIYGTMGTTLKKSSGTNHMIDTVHGQNFIGIHSITFDGNNLGGSQLIWRGHYSTVENIHFKNQGGTSYAMYLSGVNVSKFKNISFGNDCFGGILIDQSVDTYTPTPSYGCMYSTFDKITIAQTNGGSNLKMAGSQAATLDFRAFFCEDTQAAIPVIDIAGTNCGNICFYDLWAEPVILTAPFIQINSTTSYNIHFMGGKISTNVAQTEPVFKFINADGISIENMLLRDAYSASGRKIIEIESIKNGRFIGNTLSFLNDFDFITSNGGNEYITEKNNITRDYGAHPGIGTNYWDGTSFLTVENSEFTQIIGQAVSVNLSGTKDKHSEVAVGKKTIADDAFYDLFGDGGANSPARDFSGLVFIGAGTIGSTSENNIALLYIQSGATSGAQHNTSISIGSNVEVDVLADDTAAVLETTTDGKLGIQIGGGSSVRRFVRIYNRTGASVVLKIHVSLMD